MPLIVAAACVVAGFVAERPSGAANVTAGPVVRGLQTAVYVDGGDQLTSPEIVFRRVKSSGASVVRFTVYWSQVAPETRVRGFRPDDPADPNYRWAPVDDEIRAAVAHGLTPLVTVMSAPDWAQEQPPQNFPNSHMPSPTAFGAFAHAIATRYSGHFDGLPAVHYWQAWNEPNLSIYLEPELLHGKPVAPTRYRQLLNAFADAVHGVSSQNLVVSGGLAPFRDISPRVMKQNKDWGPLAFMRDLLCLSPNLKPTCDDPVEFDVWAQHPYTSGGPQHHAALPNDVSLGDLPEVTATLHAAERVGHIESRHPLQFWVTEFSWDSDPPDPKGVPVNLERRWVAEALYRMWKSGVDLVTWLALRDQPTGGVYQSGLYYRGATIRADKPKPILEAFRFPFVAFAKGDKIDVWGRTPTNSAGRVTIELREGSGWRTIGTLAAGPAGIFAHRFPVAARRGEVRAVLVSTGEIAVPFSLTVPPDHFYNPFGTSAPLEPRTKTSSKR